MGKLRNKNRSREGRDMKEEEKGRRYREGKDKEREDK